MRFIDEDTGESNVDFVRVSEGVSIQMGMTKGIPMPDDFISVILKPETIDMLIEFLQELKNG